MTKKYWTGKSEKSCFNCKHAEKIEEEMNYPYEPDEPARTVCENLDVDDTIFDDCDNEIVLAKLCGKHEPIEIESVCGCCKKSIKGVEHEHDYWVFVESYIPCCSKECVDKLKEKVKTMEI